MAVDHGLERVAPGDEKDGGPSGDDARCARELREERHLAEERAAPEARQHHRLSAAVARSPRYFELAARDDVRRGLFLAFADHGVTRGHGHGVERGQEIVERFLAQRAEERKRRDPGRCFSCAVVGLPDRLDDLRRLRGERGPRQEGAERPELAELREQRRRLRVAEALGPLAERRRGLVEGLVDLGPERPEVADGRHRERQVALGDGLLNGELQALDRRAPPAHLIEQPGGDDQRARRPRSALEHGRAPAQGVLRLVGQEQRECVIERQIGGPGLGEVRRNGGGRSIAGHGASSGVSSCAPGP